MNGGGRQTCPGMDDKLNYLDSILRSSALSSPLIVVDLGSPTSRCEMA